MEWHEAGDMATRLELGICSRWRRPTELPADVDDVDMHVDGPLPSVVPTTPTYDPSDQDAMDAPMDMASDSEDEDDHREQQDVDDVLQPEVAIDEALQAAGPEEALSADVPQTSMAAKVEELENAAALRRAEAAEKPDAMDVDAAPAGEAGEAGETDEVKPSGKIAERAEAEVLKQGSSNPTLSIVTNTEDQPIAGPSLNDTQARQVTSSETFKAIRASVLSLPVDTLFVNLDDLAPAPADLLSFPATDRLGLADADLPAIFPELQPYGMTELASSEIVGTSSEARKKADKKAERDDPTKRPDESAYTKLYPTGAFMTTKPTLVSALQPSRKWRKGKWTNLDESPVASDVDGQQPLLNEENTCGA